MSYFEFNGKNSQTDFGLTVEHIPDFVAAQKNTEKAAAPNRSGDFIYQSGRYANVTQSYDVYLNPGDKSYIEAAKAIANWLSSPDGYAELSDDYDPDSYRLAYFVGPLDMTNWFQAKGRATLNFDCQPQRYRKSGREAVSVPAGGMITNPGMPALPLVRIKYVEPPENMSPDVTLLLNGRPWIKMTGGHGGEELEVDTYSGQITKIGESEIWPFDATADFSLALQPGENVLTFEVTTTEFNEATLEDETIQWPAETYAPASVEIVPRWWDL